MFINGELEYMGQYTAVYYSTLSGKLPVKEFIESLDEKTQDKYFYKIDLLEEFGPQLGFPHTDSIGNDIVELRFKGRKGQIRILFVFITGKKIVLLSGFVKKTQKTPKNEINLAIKRKQDYLSRLKKGE